MSDQSDTPRTDEIANRFAGRAYLDDEERAQIYGRSRELERELAAAVAERDLNYARCASLIFSDELKGTMNTTVQQWQKEYVDAKAELSTLRQTSGFVLTRNQDNQAISLTRQNADGRVVEVLWERPSIEPFLAECEREAAHIEQNGTTLRIKFSDEHEGRCRELCAMYLREFILNYRMGKKLTALPMPTTEQSVPVAQFPCGGDLDAILKFSETGIDPTAQPAPAVPADVELAALAWLFANIAWGNEDTTAYSIHKLVAGRRKELLAATQEKSK